MVLERYLARHAEDVERYAQAVDREHARAVVIPMLGESIATWERLGHAAAAHDVLAIFVVNETAQTPLRHREANAAVLDALGRESYRRDGGASRVVIDATGTGTQLPGGQGVGLARKMGCDLAVALRRSGKLREGWIHCTDADATLPASHFDADDDDAVALLFDFWHDTKQASALHDATATYELWLRYYAAGLRWAGSPWGYVPLGSAFAVQAEAYAKVRGMPKRQGGEDFYLLAKLGKIGVLRVADRPPLRLQARHSDRAPFGTGPGVAKILAEPDEPRFYAPEVFVALRETLSDLRNSRRAEHPAWLAIGGPKGLAAALQSAKGEAQRQRKIDEWFDPLRTLKFVHAASDHCSKLGWELACARAPFVPQGSRDAIRAALGPSAGASFGVTTRI